MKGNLIEMTLPRQKELAERANRVGLNPASSSLLHICCTECGLDPDGCTCLDLAAAKLGKPIGDLSADEGRFLLGERWVSVILV